MVVAGSMVLLILVLTLILFVVGYQKRMLQQREKLAALELDHQKTLLNATLESQIIEQERIARDLHDELGSKLGTMLLQNQVLANEIKEPAQREKLHDLLDLTRATSERVRQISRNLLPPTLEKLGLRAAVIEFLETQRTLDYRVDGPDTWTSPSTELDKQWYRLALEVLNNAIKHDQISECTLELISTPDAFGFEITHNGHGLSQEAFESKLGAPGSFGLKSIASRCSAVGAEVHYTCTHEKVGTQIISRKHGKN